MGENVKGKEERIAFMQTIIVNKLEHYTMLILVL